MNSVDEDEERVSELWQLHEKGVSYQQQIGLTTAIPRQVDFYEGRQWKDSNKTANLPKPVMNYVKMIVRSKTAGLLSSPTRLEYISSDDRNSGEAFTDFAEYIAKEIEQEDLDAVAVLDGAIKGTYCYHYYWNASAVGKTGVIEGGMQGEVIDILNVQVANPCEKDLQKQAWVSIASRVPLSSVKELAEEGVADMDMILSDDHDSRYSEDMEPSSSDLCTVLTRYFRVDGEVYYDKAVRGTMLHAARAINPYIHNLQSTAKEEDGAEAAVPTNASDNDNAMPMATLYPVAIGAWDERHGCIYGLSEVEGILPNQKIVNFLYALYALAVQNAGWGKYIVTPNALNGQVITNEPGQVLIDHSNIGMEGIKRMTEPPISQAPLGLINQLIEQTRAVAGATEVMAGEQISAGMSGAAIAQLQVQAQKPIEEMRSRFWRVKERIGKIYEQFFKLYYDRREYTYSGNDGQERAVFNGEEYQNTRFTCAVEAGAATQFSEPMMIAMLEKLHDGGKIDVKTFISLYPRNALPNRTELLRAIEGMEQEQVEQLASQLEQAMAQIEAVTAANEEAMKHIESQAKTVDAASRMVLENKRLKGELIELADGYTQLESKYDRLYNEAASKINQSNSVLLAQQSALQAMNKKIQGGGGVGM